MINLTGMILKMRYCVLEELGAGGEGHLYLARDMELGIYRAIKELPISKKREARLLRLLEHPSIPGMIDYVENDEYCYLIMEYIHGKSLAQMQREGHIFQTEEILEYIEEIIQVLGYLHKQKPPVFYGDLKPENLMLSETGKLYLVDFGSAVFGYSDSQKICMGTDGFAAPEQYAGKINETSDIYALGRTVQSLMGKRWSLILWQVPGLTGFLFKCRQSDPKKRFQNMAQTEKIFSTLKKRKGQGRKNMAVAFITAVVLLMTGTVLMYQERKPSFEKALEEVTRLYYASDFNTEKGKVRQCKEAEKELQKMQQEYKGKEEQRKLLLLLAANAELQEEWERTTVYYEQLLLYDPQYEEGYGKYGIFLFRAGQENASRRLWAAWMKNNKENDSREKSRSFLIWEKMLEKNV